MLRLKDNCSHSFSSEAGLILPTAISANTATLLSVRRYYVCDRAARNGIPSGPFPLPVSRWGALAVQASIAKRWQLVTSKSRPARGSRSEAVDKQQSTVEFFPWWHTFSSPSMSVRMKRNLFRSAVATKVPARATTAPVCRQPAVSHTVFDAPNRDIIVGVDSLSKPCDGELQAELGWTEIGAEK